MSETIRERLVRARDAVVAAAIPADGSVYYVVAANLFDDFTRLCLVHHKARGEPPPIELSTSDGTYWSLSYGSTPPFPAAVMPATKTHISNALFKFVREYDPPADAKPTTDDARATEVARIFHDIGRYEALRRDCEDQIAVRCRRLKEIDKETRAARVEAPFGAGEQKP